MSIWWIMGSRPADSVQISANATIFSSMVFFRGCHKQLISNWLNGNLLTDGTRNFGYDDENQLISVWQANAWSNNFAYDGKMRRRIERDYTWSGSAWTQTNEIHFVYDGNLVIQERDASNVPQVTYTRGTDLSGSLQGAGGIGGLLARSDRSQFVAWVMQPGGGLPWYGIPTYYHADGNGNITMLISSSQMIVAKYLYDAFGSTLAKYGLLADVNNYRFSSKEWNANSGLYYYLYRFYDPNLQRWVNRDPLGDKIRMDIARPKRAKAIAILHLPFRPLEELEYPNLYEFTYNEPSSVADALGLVAFRPTGPLYPPPGPHPTPQRPGAGFCDACPGKHNWQAEGDDSSEDCVKKFMDDLGLYDAGMGAAGGIIGGLFPVTGPIIGFGLGVGFFGQLAIANSFCDGCSK